jgi:putative transposase
MYKNSNIVRLRQPDEIDDPLTDILRSRAGQLLASTCSLVQLARLALKFL